MKIWTLLTPFIVVVNSGCSLFGIRSEETPQYEVLLKEDNKEIRRYAPYIIAKTTVQNEDYKEAQTQAFRILAGYIFGKNETKQEIKMTAPVTQAKPESQKIAMTAPVTQSRSDQGWSMTFMMPSKYSLEDLPKPLDERVKFEEVPSKTVAALTFTWLTDQEKNQKKAEELNQWIDKKTKYSAVSSYKYAGYNPPWTIPFLRRQEVLIEVSETDTK